MRGAGKGKRRWISPIAVAVLSAAAALGVGRVAHDTLTRPHLTPDLFRPSTRIYARPLILRPGLSLEHTEVEGHLRRLGYRPTRHDPVGPGEYRMDRRRWAIGRRPFRTPDGLDPSGVAIVYLTFGDRIAEVQDADGRPLPDVALEPELIGGSGGPDGIDRLPVPLAEVPDHLIEAILSIEDRRFFEHGGLDLRRIAAAAWANLKAGRVVQGGSTLTQQLVKNLYLSARRSPIRKLREAAMAVILERRHTKDEILVAYLNDVYLGQDGGRAIHGVGSAAEYYFGTDLTRLDPAQAATLAAIIRGPSLYSPYRHPETARGRRDLVLSLMRERDVISEEDYRAALRQPLGLREREPAERSARYFADLVQSELQERYGADALGQGLTVFTTLDPGLQRLAEAAVREGLARLEEDAPYLVRADMPLQAALVALDPRTGQLLAMVGGRDYAGSQFNRAAHARRQPGSAFKPVVALAALSDPDRARAGEGGPLTLATVLPDEPLEVDTRSGPWRPTNYDDRFRGAVTMREALERSLNVPFARLGLAVGPRRIVQIGRRLGIESPLHPYPSLALGTSEVTPLELTRAYSVLAAGGYRAELQTMLTVLDGDGSILEQADSQGEWAFDPAEAYLVTSALRGAVERGTGRGLRAMGYTGPVAAKSGTSDDFRDAWFVGYTPALVVGVWVGYDDGHSVGLPGARAALPIFGRFLMAAVGRDGADGRYGNAEFAPPAGLEVAEIDRETGLLSGPGCRGEPELFLRGTAPDRSCSAWRWPLTSDRRFQVQTDRETARLLERLNELLRGRE